MDENEPRRTRWLAAGVCALALAAAMSVASILGWTHGGVGTGLLISSVLVTLAVTMVGDHLPTATRRQVVVACGMVAVIFAGVLGVSWKWGRETPAAAVAELGPPAQRALDELQSDCGVPDGEVLAGPSSSRILSSRVAASTEDGDDFITALVSEPGSDSAFPDEVTLSVLECTGSSWRRTLAEPMNLSGCEYELVATQLRNSQQEEVLFKSVCGSGAFLDYRVLGTDSTGAVGTLHSDSGIFQGGVAQLRDRLVVEEGGERREFVWDGEQFAPTGRASSLPAAEGLIAEFWWEPDGGHTDLVDIPVQVDERVYFQWDRARNTDDSVTSYRILASLPPSIPATFGEDERGETYLVLSAPDLAVDVTIIPNGYTWERAIEVTVRS